MNQSAGSVNIARQNAMPDIEAVMLMTEELARKVRAYRTAMSIIGEMLKKGLISDEDYAVIDTKMAEKYGLKSSTIFR